MGRKDSADMSQHMNDFAQISRMSHLSGRRKLGFHLILS